MKVSVRVFSFLREALSVPINERGEAELELPTGATLKDLFLALGIDRQVKDDLFSGTVQRVFQVMIDGQVINDFAYKLQEGQQVILFPPMSGGTQEMLKMGKFCRTFSEICRDDVPEAGGKGANLGDMTCVGLPVPPGFVILSSAYRRIFERGGLREQVKHILNSIDRSNAHALQEAETAIRALFERVVIDEELKSEILDHYRQLGNEVAVAVRSSATAEDMGCASFAGQQSTYLNVRGEQALLDNVIKCWSSLFTSQAIYYRFCNGFDDDLVSMAVVVQKMVNAEKAGVIFTVDPILKNPYQMIIEGVYGLGEGIVSGTITPDHYKIDRETCEVRYQFIAPKSIRIISDGLNGVTEEEVPVGLKDQPVLNEAELRALVKIGNLVEKHFGCPQDIEWGAERGRIYLLQSRPITTLG